MAENQNVDKNNIPKDACQVRMNFSINRSAFEKQNTSWRTARAPSKGYEFYGLHFPVRTIVLMAASRNIDYKNIPKADCRVRLSF